MKYFEGPTWVDLVIRSIVATVLSWSAASSLSAQPTEPPADLPPAYEVPSEPVAEEPAGDPTGAPGDGEVPAARQVEVVKAGLKAAEPQGPPANRHVRSIRPFRRGGGRVDWSRQGDWIAIDQQNGQGVYHIYLINIENEIERCITCDRWELRKLHNLSPAWHPSGEYLLFTVQNRPKRARLGLRQLITADRGLHGDLWGVTRDGNQAWQLTKIAENGGAIIDPHFSYEADRLVWTERVESRRGRWGYWALRVAEFSIRRGLPKLGKIETFEPEIGRGFTVAHGFTPNDRGLMISGSDFGRDILRFDLETKAVERLTHSRDFREDLAFVAPRSDRIVFVSDRGIERWRGERLPYRGDLWFLSEREGLEERLTFFNDPESDHFLGEALISDLAWSPDGKRLLVHVVHTPDGSDEEIMPELDEEGEPALDEALYMVELDDSFVR